MVKVVVSRGVENFGVLVIDNMGNEALALGFFGIVALQEIRVVVEQDFLVEKVFDLFSCHLVLLELELQLVHWLG